MSSHHIVREDQEPALLIADATIEFQFVQELLEWSPTVVVTEQALETVLRWGIKIDVVVAKQQNVAPLTITLREQSPLKLLACGNQEEALSTALYFLITSKQKAVNVIASEPLEIFEAFSSLDISVFQFEKRWSFIRNGFYQKWLPAGRTVSAFPSNGEPDQQTQQDGIVIINRDRSFWVSEF